MNKKGELSNKMETIVAIDFDTVFSKKSPWWETFTKNKLDRTFNKEFKGLTYKLYHNLGFNVYIISVKKDITNLEEDLWGRYLFFNQIKVYKDYKELAFDCKFLFSYCINSVHNAYTLDNTYTLQEFKELM